MEIQKLVELYPRLFHMAEADSWPNIKAHGLLSTTAVLDRYNVVGVQRAALEEAHRSEKFSVGDEGDAIVLRDQKPMEPHRLAQALGNGITPQQWYRWLNERAFFWAEESRLLNLLCARSYRNLEHDVLTLDTAKLVDDYKEQIWLCHMNSGNTFPIPHARNFDTFRRIENYACNPRTGKPLKNVVELVVDYEVSNIERYVIDVRRMKGKTVIGSIPL